MVSSLLFPIRKTDLDEIKGVKRKGRAPGRAGRPSLVSAGPVLASLACQPMVTSPADVCSCLLQELLWASEAPARSLSWGGDQDKHLVLRKFSPFLWPATGSFPNAGMQPFPAPTLPLTPPRHRPSFKSTRKEPVHGGPGSERAHIHLSQGPL